MKAMLIHNPAAGQREMEGALRKAVAHLEERGWHITWRETRGPGDATTCAREAVATGCDVAITAGGDGTISQVVNGLAGTKTALGVLPVGTTNVLARQVGIPLFSPLNPRGLEDAATVLVEGQRRTVDLGQVNGRYFLLWVGVGFDAGIAVEVESQPELKRRLGQLAYIGPFLGHLFNRSSERTQVVLDGKKFSGRMFMILASNIQLYAGFIRIAPTASMSDGLLDFCIFKGYTSLEAYGHLFSVFLGLHTRDTEVRYHQGRHMIVTSSKPLPVHADGDPIGTTPVDIRIVPNALHIIVPKPRAVAQPLRRDGLIPKEAAIPWPIFRPNRRAP